MFNQFLRLIDASRRVSIVVLETDFLVLIHSDTLKKLENKDKSVIDNIFGWISSVKISQIRDLEHKTATIVFKND